ncbi:unnamed protein product, partial [Ixodes hexagonus]
LEAGRGWWSAFFEEMSSQSSETSASKRSLREKTRESFRKLRKENRTKINHSMGTAYCALREAKITARQTLSNVKSAVENISNRCLQGGRIRTRYRLPPKSYSPLRCQTPVKLYTPFGIETPSPRTPGCKSARRQRTPKSCAVGTPARKLRQDLQDISDGIEELNTVAERIRSRVPK